MGPLSHYGYCVAGILTLFNDVGIVGLRIQTIVLMLTAGEMPMMMRWKFATVAALFGLLSHFALASDTPVGTWKNIDDETHQAKALIQISQDANGVLTGKIVKLLQHPDAVCDACEGDLKGKPDLGMTILWGLKPDGGDSWEGGQILDPKSGNVYSAKMSLVEGGKKLVVRGFLGISLLGRSQVWERQ